MTVHMYLYYLVNENKKRTYIGTTNNLERRIREHNRNNKHYTGKIKGEWKIIGSKYFENREEAEKEEKRLKKSKNKRYILWYFKITEPIVQRIE